MLTGSREDRQTVLKDYFANRRRYYYNTFYEKQNRSVRKRICELVLFFLAHPKGKAAWNSLTPANRNFLEDCVDDYSRDKGFSVEELTKNLYL